MLNLLIVDDEKKARAALRSVVQSYDPSIVVREAEGISTALLSIDEAKPDIILLDIQLADGTGFELLKKIHPTTAKIIFITAFEEYAVRAFRFSAVDYLMKPINPLDLKSALDRARSAVEKDMLETRMNILLSNISQVSKDQKKIVLKTTEQIFVVSIRDIIHLESDKNYTFFYLADGKKVLVSRTLKEYDELLSEYGFIRVHQSHLVNLDYIDRFEKRDGGYVVMKDLTSVPVSTRKKEELIGLLEQL
jgi:two-component system, LytTR family, response regulator